MRQLVVTEHTRIERGPAGAREDGASLDERRYDRLRAFDRTARVPKDRIFDWFDGYARTTQWVGVVQIPGLQVEILPKVDTLAAATATGTEQAQYQARRNLLYMLSVSGDIPVRSRDVARLAVRRSSLSETLAAIFADRLKKELLRGAERFYIEHQDNLRRFKGKLLVGKQALHNAAHRERFFCRYDEFSNDTVMNRVFRASCRALLETTRTAATQDSLRHCLLLLDEVGDVEIQAADFDRITLNRQNERFADLLRFCALLFAGRTPTAEAGRTRTFSLLFDMNKVFERFVVAFLRRLVAPRIDGVTVFPQAARHKRHLMQSEGRDILRLEPDILVATPGNLLVMDTKWKLLAPGKAGRGGVAETDLYQLYAYTRRYGCLRSVLLYPHAPGLVTRNFDVLDGSNSLSGERIAIRHVHLHRDLCLESERTALAADLEAIVREGLGLPAAEPAVVEAFVA